MKNQKESYSEPSLVKDTRRQQMRDSPSTQEKLIVVSLRIVCFVLMYTIVRVITSIPRTQISEQNKSSMVTKLPNECHCGHCPKDWLTYSNNCYYASLEEKSWNESLISCATKNSTLLYIDNEEEMKFLMTLSIISWIQVSREGHGRPWKWLNGSTCKLQITDNIPGEHNCAVQSLWGIKAEDCQFPNTYHCKHKPEN
ncbi:PREDICTED: NKG2-A/NKG2-B type II integral membrane protein-like [Bison bison bison]|uniref:NKG2-A/NKG2-B type II integral membrane protein-like n=1 Tax=Bison bison bison TaxID=43346 RepID=A0A6P3J0Z0_BISBB|nr:PREDICTED: NKG2-A/NKG2-B type II integral membrane protein-like [Bison bison bison]